jgi:hypothetical protein
MRALEDLEGRDGDEHDAAGLEYPPHLADGLALALVIKAVQDIERGRDVDAGIGKGELRHRAADQPPLMLASDTKTDRRLLDADRQPEVEARGCARADPQSTMVRPPVDACRA